MDDMFLTENRREVPGTEAADVSVSPDYAGVLDIVSEANDAWFNIVTRMQRLEHHAVVTENASLLTEGAKSFWDSFVELLKRIWAKITAFFKALLDMLTGRSRNAIAWLRAGENEKKVNELISKWEKMEGFQAKANWKGIDGFAEIEKALSGLGNEVKPISATEADKYSTAEYKKAVGAKVVGGEVKAESFNTDIRKALIGEDATVQTVSKAQYEACLKIARDAFPILEKHSKAVKSTIDTYMSNAITEAEKARAAAGTAGNEETDKAKMHACNSAKNASLVLHEAVNAVVACGKTVADQSLQILRGGVAHSESKKAPEKKDDNAAKKESGNLLDQFA